MSAPKLRPEQYDEIAEALEAGETRQSIARRYGVSVGLVDWTGLRLGADVPRERRGEIPEKQEPYQRNGVKVRPFTPEEDEIIELWSLAGIGITEIGRLLGRRHNSVRGRLLTLARHQARKEENDAR